MILTSIFCGVDDFYKEFEQYWKKSMLPNGEIQKVKKTTMSASEIMTIVVYFHLSGYRTFKHYYNNYICGYPEMQKAFPQRVSYNRFVELMRTIMIPLAMFLKTCRMGKVTGISFIDSTKIAVCHNKRINSHKVFKGSAKRGKTSVGWFFGFKLHLVINDEGEILSFMITPGNTDDRKEKVIENMSINLWGKLFGDKGYISKALFDKLLQKGITLITKLRKDMKNKLMPLWDKILLRKRSIIETVNDLLKNLCQIEHTRHRSRANWTVNMFAGLTAYTFLPKKPSLNLNNFENNNFESPFLAI